MRYILPILIFLIVLIAAPLNYYVFNNGDEATVYLAIGLFTVICLVFCYLINKKII